MKNLVKSELIKIPYSAFLKIEVPRFAQRVIEIVEKHNPEELKIKELFDLLVQEQPNIDKLTDRYGPHPLTHKLEEFRKMRSLYISAIRFHLKVVIRENKGVANEHVDRVKNEVNHFFEILELSKNDEMVSQKIAQFIEKVEKNAELNTAMRELNFLEHIGNLELIHADIQNLIYNKLASLSARPEETTTELKESVIRATKNMIKQIEIAQLKNTELDYAPLCKELNQLLTEYKNLINKRILFNKRKAENIENENDTSNETTPQLTGLTGSMMHLNMEGESLNGLETKQVEEEKAAAMSSKTMQLPLVNDYEA